MQYTRRSFFTFGSALISSLVLRPAASLWGLSEISKFRVNILRSPHNANAIERNNAISRLMMEVNRRTSVDGEIKPETCEITDHRFFTLPFLLCSGSNQFPAFSDKERNILEKFLRFGGMLFIDDSSGLRDSDFDQSLRRELQKIFPQNELQPLDKNHTVYRSFYLLERAYGRAYINPSLEGIHIGDLTPIIYSRNDLLGSQLRDSYGNWVYELGTQGSLIREMSVRLWVNIVMYTLCANYKQDQVHIPAILKRRK